MDRRAFLAGVAALGVAPATGRAQPRPISAGPEAVARLGQRLLRLEEDGLDPRWYDLHAGNAGDPAAVLRATGMALTDLVQGRAGTLPGRVDIRRDAAANPLAPWVAQIAEAAEPAEVLDRAALAHPDMPALKAALAAARARAQNPWPAVPSAGGTLEPGAVDGRVPARVRAANTTSRWSPPCAVSRPPRGWRPMGASASPPSPR